MNPIWGWIRSNYNLPGLHEFPSSGDALPPVPAINAFSHTAKSGNGDFDSDFGSDSNSSSSSTLAIDFADIDGGPGFESGTDSGNYSGFVNASANRGNGSDDVDSGDDSDNIGPADDSGDVDSGDDNGDVDSSDDSGDTGDEGSGDSGGDDNSGSAGRPLNMATSRYNGTGSATDLQGFNRRAYSKNAESMFGTYFDPNNATASANSGMNIHMQGNAGSEITAAQNATAYGSYTTTTKSQDVHGANQTAFFYGDGRRFEVDLFEPALHGGDVNTFTSGMWLDNVKVAETNVKASDLGFKSFHDQPMTYKMDFSPGNIKISALNAKGEWQTIVDHSDPRINDQLARETNFKQMFSAWGVNGEYNGAPVDFQVLKTGYSAQTL